MRNILKGTKTRVLVLTSVVILSSFTIYKYVFDRNDVIFSLLYDSLKQFHYSPNKLDDTFSEKVFDQYLNTDFHKKFLLQTDIDYLNRYKRDIDDEIQSQRQDFYKSTVEIVDKRIKEKENWSKELLAGPMDYSKDEEYEFDPKKMKYAASTEELKDTWRKMLKYQVLYRLDELLTRQEKAQEKGDTAIKIRPFDTLEAEARQKTLKSQEDWFRRIKKVTDRDRFTEYANAVASVYDPHTQYFAPKDKRKFDQAMSAQFEGIGARLQQKDGILKVSEIITGSPSHKQGELKPGDDILKVAQGAAEPVDITNMDMEDAIELIKGRKGTEVRLTVRKSDNSIKVIPIVRDVIELEESYAKSALLENKNKIGYIYLPTFYTDFTRTGTAHHCSQDMRKEIEKLKKQGIKGLIVDLRDNGGGSLQEVVDMAGLFFSKGPVVQVKGKNNSPANIMEDKNPEVAWDGPLTIIVNHNSASASEILAAAMQDYKRGVIVGTSSFGKGTVQSFFDLDQLVIPQFDTIKPVGSVKITQQKFYRINGGTTQLRGVIPDVQLPDPYAYIEFGEKNFDHPMPWDTIKRATYQEFKDINYTAVLKNSQKRVKSNAVWTLIEQQANEVKAKRDDSKYNLRLETFRAEQKALREQNKKYEDMRKEIKGFSATLLPEDRGRFGADTTRLGRETRWVNSVAKDIYIHEATNVINDIR
jgi:carboxyl-terminal processing protease